jgi:hypothetical protein
MILRRFGSVTAAIIAALVLGANAVAAHGPGAGTSPVSAIPVSGTFDDGNGPGTFSGTLVISRFDGRTGALVAIGTVDGTLTNALGVTTTVADRPISLPVTNVGVASSAGSSASAPVTAQQAAQSCQIVHLDFGGITLDVLGVAVTLSPISLDLTLSGLLGNILCGLLGALGGGAPAQAQAAQLNRALGLNP